MPDSAALGGGGAGGVAACPVPPDRQLHLPGVGLADLPGIRAPFARAQVGEQGTKCLPGALLGLGRYAVELGRTNTHDLGF
jgi:hypothetical protein